LDLKPGALCVLLPAVVCYCCYIFVAEQGEKEE